jgi:hypothetical protein
MAVIVRGASTNHGAEVSEDGQLSVANPPRMDGEDVASYPVGINPPGFTLLACRADPGTQTGERILREVDINEDYAIRTAIDNIVMSEDFTGTNINGNIWHQDLNGMSVNTVDDFMLLNSVVSTNPNDFANVRSYRSFPLPAGVSNYFSFRVKVANAQGSGSVIEFGIGYADGMDLATNGVFFRWTNAGELVGVLNNGGAEIFTPAFAPISDGEIHYYLISYTASQVQFWIDDILYGAVNVPDTKSAPCGVSSMPVMFRVYNDDATPASPPMLYVSSMQFAQGGPVITRTQNNLQAAAGCASLQGQTSWPSPAQTTNYVLNTEPDFAALSHTVPSYDTLGGQFQFEVPDASEDDYALFGWKNPDNSKAQKQLFINTGGLSVVNVGDTISATPVILQWAIGVGCTGASLATIDGSGSKAPRIVCFGYQCFPVGAPAGYSPLPIIMSSETPLIIDPGQYLHLILRVISGHAGTWQVIRGVITVNGFFE